MLEDDDGKLYAKIAMWTGVALVLFGAGIPNKIVYALGFTNMLIPVSCPTIAVGACFLTGALVAWHYENSN